MRIDEVVVTYFAKPHSYTTDDIVEISAHGAPVTSIAFTPDGKAVLLGTQTLNQGEGELALWEVSTGKLHYIANGRDASYLLVTPDSKRALTTSSYFSDLVEWNIDLNSPDFGKKSGVSRPTREPLASHGGATQPLF